MSSRNHQLVKCHRNYSVEEAAKLLDVHRNTVRQWIKQGLAVIDERRPTLILGSQLAEFLRARRISNKCPCGAGHIYCFRCRAAVAPAGDMVDYQPDTPTLGCLIGICPNCDSLIYRRASLRTLERARGTLNVKMLKGGLHIVERSNPHVNSDFGQARTDHDYTQLG